MGRPGWDGPGERFVGSLSPGRRAALAQSIMCTPDRAVVWISGACEPARSHQFQSITQSHSLRELWPALRSVNPQRSPAGCVWNRCDGTQPGARLEPSGACRGQGLPADALENRSWEQVAPVIRCTGPIVDEVRRRVQSTRARSAGVEEQQRAVRDALVAHE